MQALYDKLGHNYDVSRKADPQILDHLTQLLEIDSGTRYLDIACGTGNYAAALSSRGGRWCGFDQSQMMLDKALSKTDAVEWKKCQVEQIAYPDESFDGAICTLAAHHFSDLTKAFHEIARVIKYKGRLIIFTATPEQMRSYWLYHYFPSMMDLSCAQMPGLEVLAKALEASGLSIKSTLPYFISPALQDLFLYSGKQRPEMYLSETVRNGISSFRNFCSESELQSGLVQLKNDIESGGIETIMEKYQNDKGDYLFISVVKNNGLVF